MRNFRETSLTGLCQRTGSEKKKGHEMHSFLLLRFTQLNIENMNLKNVLKKLFAILVQLLCPSLIYYNKASSYFQIFNYYFFFLNYTA